MSAHTRLPRSVWYICSVGAGIPDFRSPQTGIYSQSSPSSSHCEETANPLLEPAQKAIELLKSKHGLTSIGQVFNASIFGSDPGVFWDVVRLLFFPEQGAYRYLN